VESIDFEAAGLTRQQSVIMQAVLNARAKGLDCRPSNIQAEYEQLSGRGIQKPNFFTQLKHLTTTGVLVKSDREYALNTPALSRAFAESRSRLEAEIKRSEEQERLLKKIASGAGEKPSMPLIQYCSLEDYFQAIADRMGESELLCSNSIFPWTCFSGPIAHVCGATAYYNRITELSEKGSLEVRYTTPFNCGYLAGLALKAARGNRAIALKECLRTIDNMKTQLELQPNLDIHYVPKTLGLHFVVLKPVGAEPRTLYFFIFGKPGEIKNGVVINSEEMAANVYQLFNEDFKASMSMRSKSAHKVYSMLEGRFRSILSGK